MVRSFLRSYYNKKGIFGQVLPKYYKNALRTPVVIIVHPLPGYPGLTSPSAHFPTGSVNALPAAFRFKDYHP